MNDEVKKRLEEIEHHLELLGSLNRHDSEYLLQTIRDLEGQLASAEKHAVELSEDIDEMLKDRNSYVEKLTEAEKNNADLRKQLCGVRLLLSQINPVVALYPGSRECLVCDEVCRDDGSEFIHADDCAYKPALSTLPECSHKELHDKLWEMDRSIIAKLNVALDEANGKVQELKFKLYHMCIDPMARPIELCHDLRHSYTSADWTAQAGKERESC